MRIIAGKFRGVTLYMPRGKKTRPLKDLVRESIFNFLSHSNKISFKFEQSNVLDLYSGTGSFGLECLSRQAECVYFAENQKYSSDFYEHCQKNSKNPRNFRNFPEFHGIFPGFLGFSRINTELPAFPKFLTAGRLDPGHPVGEIFLINHQHS